MAVRWATRPDQETLAGTLATLPGLIDERGMKPPATIIVGEVVRLREKLDWYRAPAAVRQAHRGDPRQGPGRCALREAARAGRATSSSCPPSRSGRAADYGPLDRAIAEPGLLRLADLHQRQRRALLPRSPRPLRRRSGDRCARASAPSARPPAPPSKRCT